ncbi:MAG: GntR family transcriptional regulator [Pseudonocardiaceae bacterium]
MPEPDPPLFRRIAADLRDAIRRGEYLPGHQLPSGTALAAQYGVATQTVWNAINLLRAEGLVVGLQGAGVFVAKPRVKYYASLTGSRAKRLEADRRRNTFAQQIEPQGKTARQVSTVEELPADGEVATHLRIETGTPVAVRRRVMYADDEPLQLGDSHYPLTIVRDSKIMNPADIVEGTGQVLEDLGHVPTRYEDEITWRMPTPDETEKLAITAGTPVGRLLRTTFDQNEHPIEVYIVILPADRHILLYDVSAE